MHGIPGRPVPGPRGEALGPGGPLLRPPRRGAAVEVAHLVGDPERLVRWQAQDLLGGPDLLLPERISVRRRGVGEVGRRPADVAAQDEEGWLRVGPVGGLLEGLADGRLEPVDVVGHLAQVVHPPAIGLEALGYVVVVGQLGRPVDGDVVVVVERQQPPQPEVPGQGGGLVGDPLHEAAVARDHEGPVVAHLVTEGGPEPALRDGHADRVGEALPQRAGRDLDSRRVAVLGVPRRAAAPLAELAQVLEREVVAGEVEHGVLQDARVAVGEHEPVAVRPLRVERVVAHDAGPEHVRQGGERHGRPGVPRVGLFRGVHRQPADDIDAELHQSGVLHHGSSGGVQRHGQP